MARRRRWPPGPPGVGADELIIGHTTAFTLAPGNPLRAAACLVCGQAAGGDPVAIVSLFTFAHPARPNGAFTAAGWLIHESHPKRSDEALASLAARLYARSIEEAP